MQGEFSEFKVETLNVLENQFHKNLEVSEYDMSLSESNFKGNESVHEFQT